jgi:hypothetical protein
MIKFFRNIRQNLLMENKTGKYLKYAIGEIVLVVIGILIALQINNWNNQRIEENKQTIIFKRVLSDVENDILEISYTLFFLDSIKPIFNKVRNDSITLDLLDQGISRSLTKNYRTSLNKTGVKQLKEITNKDSLSIQIIEIYDLMESFMIPNEKEINIEVKKLIDKLIEHPWYTEWMSKTITKDNSSKELQDYFLTSMEYKHRVFYFYQLLYNNYYPKLDYAISSLKNIKGQLKDRIESK